MPMQVGKWVSDIVRSFVEADPIMGLVVLVLCANAAGIYFVARNRQNRIQALEEKLDAERDKNEALLEQRRHEQDGQIQILEKLILKEDLGDSQ